MEKHDTLLYGVRNALFPLQVNVIFKLIDHINVIFMSHIMQPLKRRPTNPHFFSCTMDHHDSVRTVIVVFKNIFNLKIY